MPVVITKSTEELAEFGFGKGHQCHLVFGDVTQPIPVTSRTTLYMGTLPWKVTLVTLGEAT